LILDGFPVGQLQQRFPTAAMLVKHAEHSHDNELAGRMAAANTIALELGWRLFEPSCAQQPAPKKCRRRTYDMPSTLKPRG
jgi:hypothetical protein